LAPLSRKEPNVSETTSEKKRHRESADRVSNVVEATLYCRPAKDTVLVAVIDHSSQQAFELSVAGNHALDPFHHPYAYASRQGIECEALLPWAA
jgi:hypothetical protein